MYTSALSTLESSQGLVTLPSGEFPKLYSVCFGEGILNESVTLVLSKASQLFFDSKGNESYQWYNIFEIMEQFFLVFLGSLFFGLFYGAISTLCLKYFKFLNQNGIVETALIFFFEYATYITTEALKCSSAFSVLVCGIFISHYNYYNLSIIGQMTSGIFLETICLILKGFLYIYLGASVWSCLGYLKNIPAVERTDFSYSFTGLEQLIILVSRFASIIIISLIFRRYEILMLCMAGIFRGCVAFSQIQSIDIEDEKVTNILRGSITIIVFVTNIIYGAFFPYFVRWNLRQIRNNGRYGPTHPSMLDPSDEKEKDKETDSKNTLQSLNSQAVKPKGFFYRLEHNYLKPFFIRDYKKRILEISEQKQIFKENNNKFAGSLQLAYQLAKRQSEIESKLSEGKNSICTETLPTVERRVNYAKSEQVDFNLSCQTQLPDALQNQIMLNMSLLETQIKSRENKSSIKTSQKSSNAQEQELQNISNSFCTQDNSQSIEKREKNN